MKVIIVGGVAGGASAAARLRRLDERAEIVLYERGEHVSFANCGMPYHIGGVIEDRSRLVLHTPDSMRARFDIDVRTRHEVVAVRPEAKKVTVRDLRTGESKEDSYDFLILSPGAKPVIPPLPGVRGDRVFTLRTLPDVDRIRALVDGGAKRAVVVGGGYVGVEMAENLAARGVEVKLVELAPQVLTFLDPEMAALAHEALRRNGIELLLGNKVTEIPPGRAAPRGGGVAGGRVLDADLVLLAIGVVPEVGLARDAGIALGPSGGIAVDEHMRTSDASIFAVGDAVEVVHLVSKARTRIPLAGPANRQGRIAANTICGVPSGYKETQGTSIIQVFGLVCAATGASSAALRAAGIPFRAARVHPFDHAGYYPGASTLHLKILYAPDDGRLLGAQACGEHGVDKRIDVLATAIRHGATVHDLEDYELAYAPPFGSAKDPINMAGFVAVNDLRGSGPLLDADALAGELARGAVLLDVRTAAERARGAIQPSLHIPIDELRARLDELPLGRTVIVYCAVGLRGYLAQRILLQSDRRALNLSGGYASYRQSFPAEPAAAASSRAAPAPTDEERTAPPT